LFGVKTQNRQQQKTKRAQQAAKIKVNDEFPKQKNVLRTIIMPLKKVLLYIALLFS
jgi:16S rRNA C1402 N4-methylase RsmH